jgi:hypothetical protein
MVGRGSATAPWAPAGAGPGPLCSWTGMGKLPGVAGGGACAPPGAGAAAAGGLAVAGAPAARCGGAADWPLAGTFRSMHTCRNKGMEGWMQQGMRNHWWGFMLLQCTDITRFNPMKESYV